MRRVVAVLVVAAGSLSVLGDVVVLNPVADNSLIRDNTVSSNQLSNGSGEGLYCGRTSLRVDYQQRGLVRFDLSGIPAGSTIQDAELRLRVLLAGPALAQAPLAAHRVLGAWGEGSSMAFGGFGAPSEAGDCSWEMRVFPGEPWATPGGDFAPGASGGGFASQVSGSDAVITANAAMVLDVQGWLDGTLANEGWIIIGDEATRGSARKFGSRESVVPEDRPRLIVTYTPPPPPPACDPDYDQNGIADQDDVSMLIDMVAGGASTSPIDPDFNCSGIADQDDVSDLIDFIASGGSSGCYC